MLHEVHANKNNLGELVGFLSLSYFVKYKGDLVVVQFIVLSCGNLFLETCTELNQTQRSKMLLGKLNEDVRSSTF